MRGHDLLPGVPEGLRNELLAEFADLLESFRGDRWRSTALDAARFCEVAYSIVLGMVDGNYPDKATKPSDFRSACRKLESSSTLPKSFRFILLPTLTSVYEVRNTRNVGHVDRDIDPSFMDGSLVVANAKWILAEFVRHFHKLPTGSAQSVVDTLSQYESPLVWSSQDVRRVLQTELSLDSKILLLLAAAGGNASRTELFDWLDEGSKRNFDRRVAFLHEARMIEAKAFGSSVQMLPPGNARVASIRGSELKAAA